MFTLMTAIATRTRTSRLRRALEELTQARKSSPANGIGRAALDQAIETLALQLALRSLARRPGWAWIAVIVVWAMAVLFAAAAVSAVLDPQSTRSSLTWAQASIVIVFVMVLSVFAGVSLLSVRVTPEMRSSVFVKLRGPVKTEEVQDARRRYVRERRRRERRDTVRALSRGRQERMSGELAKLRQARQSGGVAYSRSERFWLRVRYIFDTSE